MVGRAQQLTPRRPHRPFKRFPKVRHLPPLHHLGRVFIEPQSLRYARQRHQQAPVAPPYPGAGTLFPWSVHRDSRTETLGEQTIRPKPGPSPCLRNRLRRSQGTAPSASAIGAETTPPGPPTTVPAPSYVQAPAFQPRSLADGALRSGALLNPPNGT
jgi:hypothetical protein